MSVQLNLLPDIKKTYLKAQRTKNVIMSASILITVAAGGLVALAASYVYVVQPQLLKVSSSNIDKKINDLKGIENLDSYLTVQKQLTVLTQLHEQKPTYSRFFDFLKVLNPAPPNDIQLSSLQINQVDKQITLVGTSATYQSFTVFRDTLTNAKLAYKMDDNDEQQKEALFSNVAIQSQNIAKDGRGQIKMNFNMTLTYNENAFNFDLKDVAVEVPNMETTQSVINAPGYDPSKVFNADARQQETE